MKNICKHVVIVFFALSAKTFAQINLSARPDITIANDHPFLDASSYTDGVSNSQNKGLYFPSTDLTQWEFKTSNLDGITFPTAFNGMIVYNTATGNTQSDVLKSGQVVAVTPGFYFFYNPDNKEGTTVSTGYWKAFNVGDTPSEPWYIQGTINSATENAQNIYQQGKVAIGFTVADSVSAKKLEVKGDVKIENQLNNSGQVLDYGLTTAPSDSFNTLIYSKPSTTSLDNIANEQGAFLGIGNDKVRLATMGESPMYGTLNNSSLVVEADDVGIYSNKEGLPGYRNESSISITEKGYVAMNVSSYQNELFANAVIDVYSSSINISRATHNGADNYLYTNINLGETVSFAGSIKNSELDSNYTYVFPTTNGEKDQVLVTNGDRVSAQLQWKDMGSLIKEQFYAPALSLPTSTVDLSTSSLDDIFYDGASQLFTVKLYAIYQKQFGMVGDVEGSTRSAVRSNASAVLKTYNASELDYFITYFDNMVFDPTSVKIDANGVLTYKIILEGEISERTYMNIVFKVK